ncbi:MAG: single-stranded DNA-binding protein [Fimbriimonadaceae bacterium]|nr:single-stranded DNA-binding protein [Fimbriimonadaceae bacterium]
MSLNRVILIGRLTRDPELRTTGSGKSVTGFALAVDRRFKGADGQDVDFFDITAWGQTAEFVSNYLHKGRLVAVDGRLQTRKYTTKDGQERQAFEIVADSVQGLDRARDDAGGGGGGGGRGRTSQPANEPDIDDVDPFDEG